MKKLIFLSVMLAFLSRPVGLNAQTTENCTNSIDDDGDGLIDCLDPDCAGEPACASLIEPLLPEGTFIKGVVNDTGTFFEVTNSDYLNVSLTSTEEIALFLSSVSQMITMNISPVNGGTTSTTLTISNLLPSTTYYKYEDSYHNLDSLITDANGSYTWTQDLTAPHHVWLQTKKGTIFICDDATGCGCTTIGIWDAGTKTCTLTTDVTQSIQINNPGITLDGNGHTLTGLGTGYGVYIPGINNITIKNCAISNFSVGIYNQIGSYNTLTNNSVSINGHGIFLTGCSGNNITDNTVFNNNGHGIFFMYSSNNNISNNTVSNNFYNAWRNRQKGVGKK